MPDRDDFPRCETCEHYKPDKETYGLLGGLCQHPELVDEYGRSDKPIKRYIYGDGIPPDFGCVLHSSLQSEDDT